MASPPAPMPYLPNSQLQQQQQQKRRCRDVVAIVFASLVLILSVIFICVDIGRYVLSGTRFYGPGLWFIVLWLLTGIFGVLSGTKRKKPYVITVLVLSIITMIMVYGSQVILGITLNDQGYLELGWFIPLLVLSLLMFIAALGSSITTCVVLCNCCPQRTEDRVHLTSNEHIVDRTARHEDIVYVDTEVPMVVTATSGKQPPAGNSMDQANASSSNYTHLVHSQNEQERYTEPLPNNPAFTPEPPTGPQPHPYEDPLTYIHKDQPRWSPASAVLPTHHQARPGHNSSAQNGMSSAANQINPAVNENMRLPAVPPTDAGNI